MRFVPFMPPCRHAAMPLLLSLSSLSCELTEVTVAPGTRLVVVQSVINRTASQQFVVVEYSQTGETDLGSRGFAPGTPKTPIRGALVTIEHGTALGPCTGRVDTLPELVPVDSGVTAPGTYGGSVCPLAPGDPLLLRVETPNGEVVTGSTTVPGASARDVAWTPRPGGLGYPLAFDRERDTLRIGVSPTTGRALQIEVRNSADLDELAFFAFTDTMGMSVPGNLVNPFEGNSGSSLFRAGRDYTLAVALTDTNYYDFLRSRSDPFTGSGFINHLTGGIGVFGSVETVRYSLHVVAPIDDPREGVYRLTGLLESAVLDARLELYLDDVEPDRFSAFVRCWPVGAGCVDPSSDGTFSPDGSGAMSLHFQIPGADALPLAWFALTGVRRSGGAPFLMTLNAYRSGPGGSLVGTLTAQQISGPGIP